MTLYTDSIFLTNETEGFKQCRDTRWEISTTVLLCTAGFIDVFYRGEMLRIGKDDIFIRVPNATKLGPFEMSPDFRFMQISIPITLFESLMYGNMRVEPNWWAKQEYLKLHPVFHLSAKSIEVCEVYFHLLTLQLQDHPASRSSCSSPAVQPWSCSIIWIRRFPSMISCVARPSTPATTLSVPSPSSYGSSHTSARCSGTQRSLI